LGLQSIVKRHCPRNLSQLAGSKSARAVRHSRPCAGCAFSSP